MCALNVYWRTPDFDPEEQATHERLVVHTGVLTDAHDAATPESPVLVEERSERVYHPGDLPPESVVYVEDHPGPLPPLAQLARRAGFRVEYAGHDPGMADLPRAIRNDDDPEEAGKPRRGWYSDSSE